MTPKVRNFRRRHCAYKAAKGTYVAGKVWSAMRMLRSFSAGDVAAVVEITSRESVRRYANFLVRAGFLRVTRHGLGRCPPASYQLIRDTGPLPPGLYKRHTVLYDFNTDTEYPLK